MTDAEAALQHLTGAPSLPAAAAERDDPGGVAGGPHEVGFRPSIDAFFDQELPPELRELSETHWTPACVVSVGARWLVELGVTRVLDVGSGVGKFCTLASLETPLTCVGVEQRPALLEAARLVALRLSAKRCRFMLGGLEVLDSVPAGALYFYNPFAENIAASSIGIDETVELTPKRFLREVRGIEAHLRRAPVGQVVLTFHGFGGRIPLSYRQLRSQPAGSDFLRLFQKTESEELENRWWGDGRP